MSGQTRFRFRVLGRLSVIIDGEPVALGPRKQRLLLAMLLCRPNRVVPVDELTESLWNDDPPRTARKNLQVYVATLRRSLGERIRYVPPGYLLRVSAEELDLTRFEGFAAAGRRLLRQGDRAAALAPLDSAVRCWREPALGEFADAGAAIRESERLATRFLSVYEDWAELRAELGHHAEVLDSIEELTVRYPFRERLTAARMTSLARCGRTAEALAHYDDVRQRMSRELGIAPSPVLTLLYQRILDRHGGAPGTGPELSGPAAAVAWPADGCLPADLIDFVGRAEELRVVGTAMRRSNLVVITGLAGTGKTATAVRAAHHMKADFTDGVMFVPLQDPSGCRRGVEDVVPELLRSAGFTGMALPRGSAAVSLWRSWLADRRMLFVLDGAPDEGTVRSLLPELDGNKVLVTSRRRLSGLDGAVRVPLAELSTMEALDLLGRLIGAGRLLTDHGSAQSLVEHCGRMPLAVRIVGTKLAMLPELPLHQHTERLADDLVLFDELTTGEVSVRQRLDDCVDPAAPHCREALRQLCLAPPSALAWTKLPELLADDPEQAERTLRTLLELNLLSYPDGEVIGHAEGYQMVSLLRRYGRSLLPGARRVSGPEPAGGSP
jgi:DNA-binding SARP family transcriptional activator